MLSARNSRGRARGSSNPRSRRTPSWQQADPSERQTLDEPPPFFPPFVWHSSGGYPENEEIGIKKEESSLNDDSATTTSPSPPPLATTKRTSSMLYVVAKQRSLIQNWQDSSHYLHPHLLPTLLVDHHWGVDCLQPRVTTTPSDRSWNHVMHDSRYTPPELVQPWVMASKSTRKRQTDSPFIHNKKQKYKHTVSLDDIAIKVESNVGGGAADQTVDSDSDQGSPAEAEDEVEDYTMNYYASDHDGDYDDDNDTGGEAVF